MRIIRFNPHFIISSPRRACWESRPPCHAMPHWAIPPKHTHTHTMKCIQPIIHPHTEIYTTHTHTPQAGPVFFLQAIQYRDDKLSGTTLMPCSPAQLLSHMSGDKYLLGKEGREERKRLSCDWKRLAVVGPGYGVQPTVCQ